MWMQKEDLLGLVVGLALGGAALYFFMPGIEAVLVPALRPAAAGRAAAPPVVLAPPNVAQNAPPAPVVAVPDPAPLPSIADPDVSAHPAGAVPVPAVIGPSPP